MVQSVSLLLLVHPNVIHNHFIGKLGVVDFEAGPVAAYGYVQQNKEGLVEFFRIAGVILYGNLVVGKTIYGHTDKLLVPCHFVIVELGDVKRVFLITEIVGVVAVLGVFFAVCPVVGSVYDVLAVDGFDNVYFATFGPAHIVDVCTKHPEGGPNAFAYGERYAGLDGAVGEIEFALGDESSGMVNSIVQCGSNVELAVGDVGVFAAIGVVFFFPVAPAFGAVAGFKGPFGCVDSGPVEFVVPEGLRGE